MQSTNKQVDKDTETLILEAAEREFLTKGFAAARTTSIAEAAGVTHAMLHYYFRTKHKLFDKIVSDKFKLIKELSEIFIDPRLSTLEDVIKNLIEAHLDIISKNPEVPRFIIGEIYSDTERSKMITDKIKNYANNILPRLQSLINESVAKGKCRPVDSKTLLLDIVSLNLFPYLATPVVNSALDNYMESSDFLAERKRNIFQTIMSKLRP